ncbi:MAG: Ku protein [Steroidobacteraceae bacterium]
MAARSIASLTISFGLVAIPVKQYTATQSAGRISFNMLHAKCGSRLKQQYVCIKEDVVVERDEIIKGYEFAKDQYVKFTPEELKALEEAGTQTIDVTEFVPMESIDPIYFERTYYLAPDKGGAKPYALFTKALQDAKRFAVGHWAARGQSHIVALRPVDGVLVMQQLLFATEVRPPTEVEVPKMDVREPELKLARQLIDQQTSTTFDPAAYTDEVKARIEAAIQKKVEGEEIAVSEAPTTETTGKVIDLMSALRASLEKTEAARGAASRIEKRKPPKRVEKPAAAAKRATRKG